jgi:hypothetical protein
MLSDQDLADVRQTPRWLDYYRGWVGATLDSGGVHPGTSCLARDAELVLETLGNAYAERRRSPDRPSLWIIGDSASALHPPVLAIDALNAVAPEIWQSPSAARQETHGGVTLAAMPCWSRRADPSFEISARDPATYAAALRPHLAPSQADQRADETASAVLEARRLMETCLGALATLQGQVVPPFPNGVADVDVTIAHGNDGALEARIRVSGSVSPSDAERLGERPLAGPAESQERLSG